MVSCVARQVMLRVQGLRRALAALACCGASGCSSVLLGGGAGGRSTVHAAPRDAGAASHVDLLAYLYLICVCGWCVSAALSVPRARPCVFFASPTLSWCPPCCGRRFEGSRLEARDPCRLPRSRISDGPLRLISQQRQILYLSWRRLEPTSGGKARTVTEDHARAAPPPPPPPQHSR